MVISSYSDLTPLGKIIYASREGGRVSTGTVQLYATRGKIPQEEADFIIACFP